MNLPRVDIVIGLGAYPRRIACPRTARGGGFSLLELVVVMSMLSIMLSMMIPIFNSGYQEVRKDAAVRDLIATLRYTQERAITDEREYRFYLDTEKQQYWIMMQEGFDDRGDKIFIRSTRDFGRTITLPDRIQFDRPKALQDRSMRDADAYYLTFYPTGASDRGTLKLTTDAGDKISLEAVGALGRFEVEE